MTFFDLMMASFNRNFEVNDDFPGDYSYKFSKSGDIETVSFIERICPSDTRFGKTFPYSFVMSCDNVSKIANVRAKLYHNRNKITPEDLISIGNDLNTEFPYCPFFFDEAAGRGVVATEISLVLIHMDEEDDDDDEFYTSRTAMNQLNQFYHKLFEVSKAYIRHDCV